MSSTVENNKSVADTTELPAYVVQELGEYRDWIKKYRAMQVGEIKMQKIRLQLGTYAQRQEGVQMNRIKLPGGLVSGLQLRALADVADKYASNFIHFTTRQDAQLYYLKLEDCPDMMTDLERAGITTREACGNTVRNITACCRSGMSATQVFDVAPYAEALYEFLVRNKWNQVMGRKIKIAFESCSEDHAGMLYHDFGFQAVIQHDNGTGRRGFRTWIAGGLGAVPMLGYKYSDFVPEEDLLRLGAAMVRVFDRFGERKNRMQARQKYLAKTMGHDEHRAAVEKEFAELELPASVNDYIAACHVEDSGPPIPNDLPANPDGVSNSDDYKTWRRDNVIDHRCDGYKGVNVRLRLGDILAEPARGLADIADTFSRGQMSVTLYQNLLLKWVPEQALPALYDGLKKIGLADAGAETIEDTTTCPGADTCRLGITSAKGLGAKISADIAETLGEYKEIGRDIAVKISGCPNSCAQHMIANIAFQSAATKKHGKSVPSQFLFLSGVQAFDDTAVAWRVAKYPTRNCPIIVERLLKLYASEKNNGEVFNECMNRLGKDHVKGLLADLERVGTPEETPEMYEDWGHDNEEFAVRQGVKGECAGAPVQEKVPTFDEVTEKLAQAKAFLAHKEYANAQIEAFEAMGAAARVVLYTKLCDPFTTEHCLWEFENIFVRAGLAPESWMDSAESFTAKRDAEPSKELATEMIESAKAYLADCETVFAELTAK